MLHLMKEKLYEKLVIGVWMVCYGYLYFRFRTGLYNN
ncbi:hypothetical protein Desgi_2178 [Desulfoscipio gibsoniae DSM 7213]|uniref:Uncharacterized protein n=1 Tax=Desulfoscipio gibsoniae DSM 7213 TaxID=767817 RepID=R4KJ06_9FIRM|nr:hypothetical protein Desgi_2178 [Desulfoscipio gibsoniae DSM 7213]